MIHHHFQAFGHAQSDPEFQFDKPFLPRELVHQTGQWMLPSEDQQTLKQGIDLLSDEEVDRLEDLIVGSWTDTRQPSPALISISDYETPVGLWYDPDSPLAQMRLDRVAEEFGRHVRVGGASDGELDLRLAWPLACELFFEAHLEFWRRIRDRVQEAHWSMGHRLALGTYTNWSRDSTHPLMMQPECLLYNLGVREFFHLWQILPYNLYVQAGFENRDHTRADLLDQNDPSLGSGAIQYDIAFHMARLRPHQRFLGRLSADSSGQAWDSKGNPRPWVSKGKNLRILTLMANAGCHGAIWWHDLKNRDTHQKTALALRVEQTVELHLSGVTGFEPEWTDEENQLADEITPD